MTPLYVAQFVAPITQEAPPHSGILPDPHAVQTPACVQVVQSAVRFAQPSHISVAGAVFHQWVFAKQASQVTQLALTVVQFGRDPHPPPVHDHPSPEGVPEEQAVQSPSLFVES